MPDSDLKSVYNQSPLDKLVAEAEEQPSTLTSVTPTPAQSQTPQVSTATASMQSTAKKCDHDNSDVSSRRWCRSCRQLICQFCWSVLDSNYCISCMQTVDLTVTESTIVDDEGVTHQGRLITPSTGFNKLRWSPNGHTTAKLLCEMSRLELIEFIEMYRSAVRDAERALDFRRIRLSSAQLELDERRDQERRVLRSDKKKYPVHTVTVDTNTGKQIKQTASSTKMLKMLKALEALQKLKQKKP